MFFVGFSAKDVFVHVVLDLVFNFRTQGFDHFGGGAQHEGIGRNDHALGYHGVGADDAVFADLGVIEDGGMHANQHVV